MPIRLAGNLAMRKNKLMLLLLQTRNRRNWRRESKGWWIRSKLFLHAITARWAGVGVAPSTDAQVIALRVGSATCWVLYFFCPCHSLGESLTAPAQLCDCDREPELPICSSCMCFPKDVHVALLITCTLLISYGRRNFVALMGSHLRGLKISRWPQDLQDKEAFWQGAGSAGQGAADCHGMGKAASSPKCQHSHLRRFSTSLKLACSGFEGRIRKWHFGLK